MEKRKILTGWLRCKVKDIKFAHFYTREDNMEANKYYLSQIMAKMKKYKKVRVTIEEVKGVE